jgi:hypothetical protein
MNPLVEPVPDALLFDTDSPCSLGQLLALKAVGFQGGVRTVTVDAAPDPTDVTAQEVQAFMAAGLGLMLYQRPRAPGWIPSAALGRTDAAVFVAKAARAGYLAGGSTWDDLEGIGAGAAATVAYANEKAEGLKAGKYAPGAYVGDDVPLTGDELFRELLVAAYWRSVSDVPDVAVRGYALVQVAEDVSVAGTVVDVSVARADEFGGRPYWMRNAA